MKTSIIGVGDWAAGATAVMEGVGGPDCMGGELLDSAGNVAGWSAGAGDGDTFSISIEQDTNKSVMVRASCINFGAKTRRIICTRRKFAIVSEIGDWQSRVAHNLQSRISI
ncbi:MAG: hypothetical protein L0332_01305 [Chloroflexi bacterium]|nr:hypothetical protein [Chloroflexota bacterium]MCI0577423.1 hypothetical protein [Chloroflexota bacterium]MCI0649479.1 hypothetical protein [Chloroflexota bacterium]MCI0725359.1 hypothetical protein [Chloroflexota bacterium]